MNAYKKQLVASLLILNCMTLKPAPDNDPKKTRKLLLVSSEGKCIGLFDRAELPKSEKVDKYTDIPLDVPKAVPAFAEKNNKLEKVPKCFCIVI